MLDLSIRHNDTQNAKHVKAEEKLEFDRQDTLVHFTKDFDQNRQRENTDLTDIDAMRHGYEEYINSVQNITNVSMLSTIGLVTRLSVCRRMTEADNNAVARVLLLLNAFHDFGEKFDIRYFYGLLTRRT